MRFLARPRARLSIAVLGCLLCLPALLSGLMMDDFHLWRAAREGPFDLFAFTRTADVPRLVESGALPWWTPAEYRFSLWRPLASATHWVDFTLWPGRPALMHLQSLGWLAALILLVGHLHRRWLGAGWIAGLATLIYALDDTHATPAGWIANRNYLIAACFGLGALALHHRWREGGSRIAAALAPVALLAGLLANEGAVAILAYLLAFALFLDRGAPVVRVASLAPSVLVVGLWRFMYEHGGYGVVAAERYVDPLVSPFRFTGAVLFRGPALLLGQWALPPSDLFSLGLLPPAGLALLWILAVVVLGCVTLLLLPFLRTDRTSRYLFSAMLFAIVPACAARANDRLLLFAGAAATALLARFLGAVVEGWTEPARPAWTGKLRRPFFRGFVAVHLFFAPLLLVTNLVVFRMVWSGIEKAIVEAPLGARTDATLVVFNSRYAAEYIPLLRERDGRSAPRRIRNLGPLGEFGDRIRITRQNERTLVVRPAGGFPLSARRMAAGEKVRLSDMTAEVLEAGPRGPLAVAYEFDRSLDDASLVWLRRSRTAFEFLVPPPIGETLEIRRD